MKARYSIIKFGLILFAALAPGRSAFAADYDFGDAPAIYPTLLADTGAQHAVAGNTIYLGPHRDAETDGQPGPGANGDDLNPLTALDDEDGVTFNAALVPGAPGSVWLQLIYGDGHPFAGLPSPSNTIDLAFALGTDEDIQHKMHWPQLPDRNGWDVRACYDPADELRKALADDFLCTSNGLITEIAFWGSWIYDDITVETLFGLWGWKTSGSEHFMDDAVWADRPVSDTNQWKELRDPLTNESLDLAFIINGGPDERPYWNMAVER